MKPGSNFILNIKVSLKKKNLCFLNFYLKIVKDEYFLL